MQTPARCSNHRCVKIDQCDCGFMREEYAFHFMSQSSKLLLVRTPNNQGLIKSKKQGLINNLIFAKIVLIYAKMALESHGRKSFAIYLLSQAEPQFTNIALPIHGFRYPWGSPINNTALHIPFPVSLTKIICLTINLSNKALSHP